ncbi:MAG: D-isomer specific 2-hydroxyacid dehydrogenase family protein [Clostridia bacterium]|nr:D-isomer specific 2-hydroxyacid dehydrogenase family protein [Clostridia bacterium]
MKLYAFEVRGDELSTFAKLENENLEITTNSDILTEDNISLAEGCEIISTLGMTRWDRKLLKKAKETGVKCISTRTIGYNHIDINAAKELGIHVCNVHYSPDSVADFTLMLMLVALRKYKPAVYRQNVNDFSLGGLQGRTLSSMTVGVVGTGKIGYEVIKRLKSFGAKVLAYDVYRNPKAAEYAEYVSLDDLYANSDMISYHIPLTSESAKMVNSYTLSKMKDGVVLVNTARGELMDVSCLIKGIESEKIGALATDVFDGETDIYHKSRVNDIISNRDMAYLRQFPNVVMTQHMAFYTGSAVEEMVTRGVNEPVKAVMGEKSPCLIV